MAEVIAKWITRVAYPGTGYPFYNSRCSNCGFQTAMVLKEWENKCPKCLAVMKEEQSNDRA